MTSIPHSLLLDDWFSLFCCISFLLFRKKGFGFGRVQRRHCGSCQISPERSAHDELMLILFRRFIYFRIFIVRLYHRSEDQEAAERRRFGESTTDAFIHSLPWSFSMLDFQDFFLSVSFSIVSLLFVLCHLYFFFFFVSTTSRQTTSWRALQKPWEE